MIIINETPLEASFYGFYTDKHRRFFAILTEILPQFGYFESLLHLSESKTILSLVHVLGP